MIRRLVNELQPFERVGVALLLAALVIGQIGA
jgi:hypothetical protein